MEYPVQINGFEGQSLAIQSPGLLAGPKLLIDGQQAPRGQKRNQVVLRRSDGAEVVATWKPRILGLDVPDIEVEGERIRVAEPLKWYQWMWAALPGLLVFVGGALGALFGALALFVNIKIFRSQWPGVLKYLSTIGVFILVAVVVSILAGMVRAALGS